jgi:XapX domain-containing protein
MTRSLLGLLLALLIGAGCRVFDVPVPSPHKLMGALLVLAITVGYVAADQLMTRNAPGAAARPGEPPPG